MPFDAHKNLAYSTVATAPSPAASGTSLVVSSGHGTRFPAVPFNATVWPANTIPDPSNSEIVRVTAVASDTFTITRAQESTSARTIVVGDQIAATITQKTLEDVEKQGLRQSFRGLQLRTHPDADVAASKVMLVKADRIVMHDGEGVDDWSNLVADITVAGAGGLDTGAEGASRWYEIYAIRKSSDGTKNLLLHRAKNYGLDQSLSSGNDGASPVRFATGTRTAIGQGFTPAVTGSRPFIDVFISRTGTVTGRIWLEIQTSSGGLPTNTVLATSDKLDASLISTTAHWVRFVFRSPVSLTASTVYQIVMTGDWTASDANYIAWAADETASPYAGGANSYKDGGTWVAGGADDDFLFKDYATQNDTAVTMPTGYDQRCLIGYVYNDSSSNFVTFHANDRDVLRKFSDTATVTSSTPSLLDLSAVFPPVPVSIVLQGYGTNAGDTGGFSPLSPGGASSDLRVFATASTAGWYAPGPIAVLEAFQFIYMWLQNGTGNFTMRANSYRW